ncbi:MAG TPA: universal stress protein, partial [Alphaproteobacteria bacterium]|nr:universal stress protein [Alphaproteobacteria bacterium]
MSAVVVPIVPAIQLKRILYSTDLSSAARTALPIVASIARNFKSQVYAAYVWSPLPYTMVTPEAASQLEVRQERDARREVERIGHSPELKGVPVLPLVASGDAANELKRMVRENHIDLAVLSTHGRTGL